MKEYIPPKVGRKYDFFVFSLGVKNVHSYKYIVAAV